MRFIDPDGMAPRSVSTVQGSPTRSDSEEPTQNEVATGRAGPERDFLWSDGYGESSTRNSTVSSGAFNGNYAQGSSKRGCCPDENKTGARNWSTTIAAFAISGVLVADDATGVGVVDDVAIPFILAGAIAADLYKRQREGAQYTLRASKNGLYPVYSWGSSLPTGTQYLNAGDIWKIGETIQYDQTSRKQWRYSDVYLKSMSVEFVPEYVGPKSEIVFVQQMKLAQYLYGNGSLPAGNKGLK